MAKYRKGQIIEKQGRKWKIRAVNPHKNRVSGMVTANLISAENIKKGGKIGKHHLTFWDDKPVSSAKVTVRRSYR